VNTFLPKAGQEDEIKKLELMRSSEDEKLMQIDAVRNFRSGHACDAEAAVKKLQHVARARENIFAELMESVKHLSLGQISAALYAVGGEYRRNM
jgi:methylmalonyl-CoA mutase